VKYLLRIPQQSIILETDQDPDMERIRLSRINYRLVEVPAFTPGQALFESTTGDLGYYVGPTQDGHRAVVQFAGSKANFAAVEWDELEPAEKEAL
jgi:hypothetical protein